MKKIITASMALLSVLALAACSGKPTSESPNKASSSVEKTSSSETKSSNSETSSKSAKSNEKRDIVLLTDEEIENARTIGDMKTLYGKLIDNYKNYITEIGEKMPEAGKEAYNKQVEPAVRSMETSRETFNDTLSSVGSDDTVVPEQGRTMFVEQLKNARDIMKTAIEGAYKALESFASGQ